MLYVYLEIYEVKLDKLGGLVRSLEVKCPSKISVASSFKSIFMLRALASHIFNDKITEGVVKN